ncbi:unnamed protein product [Withania somnifera]
MSNNQAKEPIVYVRRRSRMQRLEEVVASSTQLEFSSKEIGQTSPKAQCTEPNKLLENKEAKSIKKGRTKCCSNSSKLNTRRSKGEGAGNAKVIRDDTWKPQTQEETNLNDLTLVYGGNIDYVTSHLDFAKDLGGAAQRLPHTRVCRLNTSLNDNTSRSTNNVKRKGKEIYQERNNTMDFVDFYTQRRNKGITICKNSVNSSSSGEMTKHLGTSNNHSSGQILHFQDMNHVSPNYFLDNNSMKEMSVSPRHHKPRAIVHPSKIVGPSRFSQRYDQYKQRTSVPAPINFSLMKLIMGGENISTLTNEELLYAKELLGTDQGLSSEGQRVQQWPCSQVGNYQNMQTTSGSATLNFSFMKLLMEDDDSSLLTEELNKKQFLGTQCSLSSEGQRVQQWPCSQVGNYQFANSVQQINLPSCQNKVLQQPQQISYIELLKKDDISYMDLLTRVDISWT